jgi:hypothetical protein
MKVPVKNNKMVRDTKTNAILSVDIDAIKAYEEKRRKIQTERDRLNRLELEVLELRSIIDQLRNKP